MIFFTIKLSESILNENIRIAYYFLFLFYRAEIKLDDPKGMELKQPEISDINSTKYENERVVQVRGSFKRLLKSRKTPSPQRHKLIDY